MKWENKHFFHFLSFCLNILHPNLWCTIWALREAPMKSISPIIYTPICCLSPFNQPIKATYYVLIYTHTVSSSQCRLYIYTNTWVNNRVYQSASSQTKSETIIYLFRTRTSTHSVVRGGGGGGEKAHLCLVTLVYCFCQSSMSASLSPDRQLPR